MTILEIILSIILYISIGSWISMKRNWYRNLGSEATEAICCNLILMPLALILVIIRELFVREWDDLN
jgi:hypothetical protein